MQHIACNHQTGLDSVWEWLHLFCSQSQFGNLKEPKLYKDHTGNFPDDKQKKLKPWTGSSRTAQCNYNIFLECCMYTKRISEKKQFLLIQSAIDKFPTTLLNRKILKHTHTFLTVSLPYFYFYHTWLHGYNRYQVNISTSV